MDDLLSRLLAAIEETERLARRVAEKDEAWDESAHDRLRLVINDRYPGVLYDDETPPRGPLIEAWTLADPASVLRRCAADRAIVERCTERRDGYVLAQFVLKNLAAGYGITDHQEGVDV